jgi:hypothetical protein
MRRLVERASSTSPSRRCVTCSASGAGFGVAVAAADDKMSLVSPASAIVEPFDIR